MRRWIVYAIGTLVTLVVLAGVGLAGYHMGLRQGASFGSNANGRPPEFGPALGFGKEFNDGGPGFRGDQGSGRRDHGFEHGRGEMHFFSPLFGLAHLVLIGLLLWLVYVLYKRSGWQFVRVKAQSGPDAANDEKKARRKTKS